MTHPKQATVVESRQFTLDGGAKREALTLDCGHTIERALRRVKPKRAVCPVCNGGTPQ